VAAQADAYWPRQAAYVLSRPPSEPEIRPYRAAFGLRNVTGFTTRANGIIYIETSTPDSNLVIIRHEPERQRFVAMRVQAAGQSLGFQRGRLLWSGAEGEWF